MSLDRAAYIILICDGGKTERGNKCDYFVPVN